MKLIKHTKAIKLIKLMKVMKVMKLMKVMKIVKVVKIVKIVKLLNHQAPLSRLPARMPTVARPNTPTVLTRAMNTAAATIDDINSTFWSLFSDFSR